MLSPFKYIWKGFVILSFPGHLLSLRMPKLWEVLFVKLPDAALMGQSCRHKSRGCLAFGPIRFTLIAQYMSAFELKVSLKRRKYFC